MTFSPVYVLVIGGAWALALLGERILAIVYVIGCLVVPMDTEHNTLWLLALVVVAFYHAFRKGVHSS